MSSSVLQLKRRLKVMMRTPEHERDSVWKQEVDAVQAEIAGIVGQVTATAPRQEAAREMRVRELAEEREKEKAQQQQDDTARPSASVTPATPPPPAQQPTHPQQELRQRSCEPAAAAAAPVQEQAPPSSSSGGRVGALHPALAAMAFLRDLNSRTEYGLAPLLFTCIAAAVLSPDFALAATLASQALLCVRYIFTSLQHQNAAYSCAVFAARDVLPVLAVYMVTAVVVGDAVRERLPA